VDILRLLPANAIVATELLSPGPVGRRLDNLEQAIHDRGWSCPLCSNPTLAKEVRVRLVADRARALEYLQQHPERVLAQEYHAGRAKRACSTFGCRGSHRTDLSITDKRFAAVEGDGRSSTRSLIWRHRRYRLQAQVFLRRLENEREMFRRRVRWSSSGSPESLPGSDVPDGAHLATPALAAAFDAIADQTPGFFFGRFDVRYSDPAEFRAGRGFRIVELNGLLSESTNIYDPGLDSGSPTCFA